MGGFFSSEPVTPLLQNTIRGNRVNRVSNVSVASSIVRYKSPKHAFDIFERPPSALDIVYEHDKECEEVRDHPVEERVGAEGDFPVPTFNEVQQIQDIGNKEFHDLKWIGVEPVMVTDDIILRRQRSLHPNMVSKSSQKGSTSS